MQILTAQELHNLAMNIVGKTFRRNGIRISGDLIANSKDTHNLYCLKKEKKNHFLYL